MNIVLYMNGFTKGMYKSAPVGNPAPIIRLVWMHAVGFDRYTSKSLREVSESIQVLTFQLEDYFEDTDTAHYQWDGLGLSA